MSGPKPGTEYSSKPGPEPGTRFGGRQAGTPNIVTANIRDKFQELLENNMNQLQEDIDDLKPEARVNAIMNLAKFVLPTLKAVEFSGDIITTTRPQLIFKKSSDGQS